MDLVTCRVVSSRGPGHAIVEDGMPENCGNPTCGHTRFCGMLLLVCLSHRLAAGSEGRGPVPGALGDLRPLLGRVGQRRLPERCTPYLRLGGRQRSHACQVQAWQGQVE